MSFPAEPFGVTDEDSRAARKLRAQMKSFYDTVTDYDAFADTSAQPLFWAPIIDEVRRR